MANQTQSSSSRAKIEPMSDWKLVEKYDGKRVRINGMMFVIRVSIDKRILVSADPIQSSNEGYEVSTFMTEDKYPDADITIKKAIRLVHKIADEIEDSLKADFNEEEL